MNKKYFMQEIFKTQKEKLNLNQLFEKKKYIS